MRLTARDYLARLQDLLPTGAVWPRDDDSWLTRLLLGLAGGFSRTRNRAVDLLDQLVDPRNAVELLTDWEAELDLPDPCAGQAETVAERQARAYDKLTARADQRPAYFIARAAALGFTVTVTEHAPAHCQSDCTAALDPDEVIVGGQQWPWRYVFEINAPADTIHELDCVSGGCDEPLRNWGNQILECVLTRIAPAHTLIRFTYGA